MAEALSLLTGRERDLDHASIIVVAPIRSGALFVIIVDKKKRAD